MNRYTGVLCLLLLLLWPASSAAQQGRVGGSVVDQTGLALPGATVTVRGAGGPRTVASDERGDFELDGIAPGPYTLTVSLPGFSDATVDGVVVPAGGLALPPVVLQLARFGDAVVVTASRNEVRLIDAPVSTSVISATTLETTPALNYGDLLRATPGGQCDPTLSPRRAGHQPQPRQHAGELAARPGGRAQHVPRLLRPRPVGPAPDQLRRRGADRGGAGTRVRGVGRQRHDRGGQHHHQVTTGIGRHDGDAQRRVRRPA